MGPGQSGLAVAAGQTSRRAEEEEHERRIECREEVLVAAELQKLFSMCVSAVLDPAAFFYFFCLMLLVLAVKTSEAMFF